MSADSTGDYSSCVSSALFKVLDTFMGILTFKNKRAFYHLGFSYLNLTIYRDRLHIDVHTHSLVESYMITVIEIQWHFSETT